MAVISEQLRWLEFDGGDNSKEDSELPLSSPPLASTHLRVSWFDDGGLHFRLGCRLPLDLLFSKHFSLLRQLELFEGLSFPLCSCQAREWPILDLSFMLDDQYCNSCEEVREAYRKKGWALSNMDLIDQVDLISFDYVIYTVNCNLLNPNTTLYINLKD
ncbi:hypothetical protein PIB30_030568 [Stylosanthes scabra]|uniref:Endoplasmic reticulum vesicle transporter C-terminal domain-containing protein n=1 Tax=Stylosanthes scabra TaxID=79078 RepID=A0ABU6TBT6_9FABA|nr:hypothetical protein [Stylosanthes scabra]